MPGRFAKNLTAVLGALLLAAGLPAAAQQGGKRGGQGSPGRQAPAKQVPASDARPPQRDVHFEGRMTPEQRRQLRRDVHDHGRDIYHRDRPGPERQ